MRGVAALMPLEGGLIAPEQRRPRISSTSRRYGTQRLTLICSHGIYVTAESAFSLAAQNYQEKGWLSHGRFRIPAGHLFGDRPYFLAGNTPADQWPPDGEPVVFVHGNVSSSIFWEETMLALPTRYRAIALDLRGFGNSETAPVDAARGVRDFADDLHALVETLKLERFHLVGWSMGGGVGMQYISDHPDRVRSFTMVSPMSPYGFGGTKDADGTPCWPDFAGSGGGTANPAFVQRLKDGDRSADSPNSPRNVMNMFYFKPPFRPAPEREEAFVSSMLSTKCTDGNYSGDLTPSANWPNVAPGTRGVNNCISPKYCDLRGFGRVRNGPPVLWIRGANDQIVSDTSLLDFGTLGQLGAVPGWPGAEVFPPQPMWKQLRAVLDAYAASGGSYREVEFAETGHSPFIERPDDFRREFFGFLADVGA
jgi:pimeloyl-ACP methyl ester carboxylesterase